MATKKSVKRPSGSREPKAVGVILDEMLRSDSRLANAYRKFREALAEGEEDGHLFKDFFPNTELGIDLKLITRKPGRIPVGAYLDGAITRDGENHFSFFQNDAEKKRLGVTQRNPHIYLGNRINVNRKADGTLYPTFNRPRYTEDFTFQDFCREAAEELLVVAGLIEE